MSASELHHSRPRCEGANPAHRRKSIRSCHIMLEASGPIVRINTFRNASMEGREGPFLHSLHQPMFHRIDVHIVHVSGKISVIADHVFPIPALPDPALPASSVAGGTRFGKRKSSGEGALDQSPARGVIAVSGREFDHAVQVVWQYHPPMDDERVSASHDPYSLAQPIDMAHQQVARTITQVHCEEEAATGYPHPTKIRHDKGIHSLNLPELSLAQPIMQAQRSIGAVRLRLTAPYAGPQARRPYP